MTREPKRRGRSRRYALDNRPSTGRGNGRPAVSTTRQAPVGSCGRGRRRRGGPPRRSSRSSGVGPPDVRQRLSILAQGDLNELLLEGHSHVSSRRPDCVAGHVGLELRNVDANYPLERSHRFAGIQPNSGLGDYSRLSCDGGRRSSGPPVPGSRQDACAGRNCRDFLPMLR
jgi:hypothetical protein